MNQAVFKDCLFLIRDGYEPDLDHPVYAKAHIASEEIQTTCAKIMALSVSEIQAVKYLEYLFDRREIEPGFRAKVLDPLVGL